LWDILAPSSADTNRADRSDPKAYRNPHRKATLSTRMKTPETPAHPVGGGKNKKTARPKPGRTSIHSSDMQPSSSEDDPAESLRR